ncbi:MAG: hypothetical protein ACRBB6_03725 [Neptuniibacter sp.]
MKVKLAFLLVPTLTLSACTSIPTTQIEAFGDQSKELSNQVNSVLEELYNSRLNKEIEMAISQEDVITNLTSLQVLDKHLFKTAKDKKTASLIKASKALSNYFNAIHQLALIGDKEKHALTGSELASAVFSLNEAHVALGKSGELISKEAASKLGKVTGSMSYLYAKNKAAVAIKEIVTTSNSPLQTLIETMDQTLGEGYVQKTLYAYREERLVANLSQYEKNEHKLSIQKRRAAVNDIIDEYRELKGTSEAIKNTRSSLKALAKAHSKLSESLGQDKYIGKEIMAAVKTLKAEVEYFTHAEEMFLDCESNRLEFKPQEGLVCI